MEAFSPVNKIQWKTQVDRFWGLRRDVMLSGKHSGEGRRDKEKVGIQFSVFPFVLSTSWTSKLVL